MANNNFKVSLLDRFGGQGLTQIHVGDPSDPNRRPVLQGGRVRLHGLKSTQVLNGAYGRIMGPLQEDGRYPVKITEPEAAVKAHPDTVRVKLENLEMMPAPPAPDVAGLVSLRDLEDQLLEAEPQNTSVFNLDSGFRSDYRPRFRESDLEALRNPYTPTAYKRAIAEDVAEAFMQGVIEDDAYPCIEYERVFGISMTPGKRPPTHTHGLRLWKAGDIMVGAWQSVYHGYVTLRLKRIKYYEREFGTPEGPKVVRRAADKFKSELVDAIKTNQVEAFFKNQVKALMETDEFTTGWPELEGQGRQSGYFQELSARDFQGIPWL